MQSSEHNDPNQPAPAQPVKKPFNWKLFGFSAAIAAALVVPITLAVLQKNKEMPEFAKYEIKADEFLAKVAAMKGQYTVRTEGEGETAQPVVHPLPGSDVYIPLRNYDFGKMIVELEVGKEYQIHFLSLDMKHAVVVHELHIQKRVKPEKAVVLKITPHKAGTFKMICGEYCGPGHADMVGSIAVVEAAATPAATAAAVQ